MILMFVVALAIELKLFEFTPADSAAVTLSVALPNWVAVGLPLFLGLYGPQGAVTVAVAIVCGNVVAVPMSLLLLEFGGVQSNSGGVLRRLALGLWRTLKKPSCLARYWEWSFRWRAMRFRPSWSGRLASSRKPPLVSPCLSPG